MALYSWSKLGKTTLEVYNNVCNYSKKNAKITLKM